MPKMNYYVLFHIQNKTNQLLKTLSDLKCFEVFYPKYEFYRRDTKSVDTKPTFPGYVFVKTELDQKEFDEVLYSINNSRELFRQIKRNNLPALSEEEIAFLELFYDDSWILRMSYGQCINKKIRIEKGPLLNLESYITKYDRHNKYVVINVEILSKKVRCGFVETDS